MAMRINQRINEISAERIQGIVRYKWRVIWTFFNNGVEIDRGSKDFTTGVKADEFVVLLRKKATLENKGIIVDKVDIKNKNKSKRFNKGFKRKW